MRAFHPLADIFPLIEGEEFDQLVASIKANGPREPIVIYEDMILDGRNRARACEVLGIEPHYHPFLDADPLTFVVDKNLCRRHLDDRQRASVAAKIAKLGHGGDRSKLPIGNLNVEKSAKIMNVAPRQVRRAQVVHRQGVPEVREALDRGEIPVSVAEEIARLPAEAQPEAVARVLPNGARAIMGSRREPTASLDYFPTPPKATRALIERVFPVLGVRDCCNLSAWEPACGEGHIAEVLAEYFPEVFATDIFEYGYGGGGDFLDPKTPIPLDRDWIITNPPFGDNAIKFVHRALELADNVAMFFRSTWAVEGIERYKTIFRVRPPTLCAFFVERIALVKGRWDPEATTATAYCWLIWIKGRAPRAPFWIPPDEEDLLRRPDDVERFTASPVLKKKHRIERTTSSPNQADTGSASLPSDDDGLVIPAFLRIGDPACAWRTALE